MDLFRQELKDTGQVQLLRRLDTSGWQHRMVLAVFTKFYAARVIGEDWDKPTADDILAIAAELAMAAQPARSHDAEVPRRPGLTEGAGLETN